jgi:GNAT superfamily N-acetyltransferase
MHVAPAEQFTMADNTFSLDSGYQITRSDQHSRDEEDIVSEGLYAYNRSHIPENYQPLNLYVRDESGEIKGGLLGATYWGWCAVNILWLPDDLRGKGYGKRLMQIAEDEARRRGCHGAHLDTMSFQALPFYQKLGYAIFGQIDDIPVGHTRYFLKKSLR